MTTKAQVKSASKSTAHVRGIASHNGGPNIEIMPSGVPQSFYMQPSKYHDAQLRAALVELQQTLQLCTKRPMNPDATPLIQQAAQEIKKNQYLLSNPDSLLGHGSGITNTVHGIIIDGTSPKINSIDIRSMDSTFQSSSIHEDPATFDNIDWDSVL